MPGQHRDGQAAEDGGLTPDAPPPPSPTGEDVQTSITARAKRRRMERRAQQPQALAPRGFLEIYTVHAPSSTGEAGSCARGVLTEQDPLPSSTARSNAKNMGDAVPEDPAGDDMLLDELGRDQRTAIHSDSAVPT